MTSGENSERTTPPPVGYQLEYAGRNLNERRIPDESYTLPLERLKQLFKGAGGPVKITTNRKESPRRVATYTDPFGREWRVEPAAVNTEKGMDGFRVVTPILDRKEDAKIFTSIVQAIEASGKYEPGIHSSARVRVNAADLIRGSGPNADVSRLVDAILYIESHWPEIYSATSPVRTGSVVNESAVPLGVHHEKMLQELASLPRAKRTLKNVQAVFKKYQRQEAKAVGGSDTAWSNRAANYRPLLGIDKGDPSPVIEFRISDLGDAATMARHGELLQRVVTAGARTPTSTFKSPWGWPKAGKSRETLDSLNQTVAELPASEYRSFLGELRLREDDHPKLGALRGPISMSIPASRFEALVEGFDTTKRTEWKGRPATFGMEAESHDDDVGDLITGWIRKKANTEDFPFLDEYVEREEETGNLEFTTQPEKTLASTIKQMRIVKREMGDSFSNFHLHIRVPKEAWSAIPRDELNAWLSRMSDVALAWRLEFKNTESALDSATHSRLFPGTPSDRGAIRAQTSQTVQPGEWEKHLGSTMDIELRGFMGDIAAAERLAKIMLLGFKHPELIQGFPKGQTELLRRTQSLAEGVNDFAKKYRGKSLSKEEREFLDRLEEDVGNYNDGDGPIYHQKKEYDGTSNLPLYGFDRAPYLTRLESIRVRDANHRFFRRVYQLVKQYHDGEGDTEDDTVYWDYRSEIQRWANEIGFHSLLERSLLLEPMLVKLNAAAHAEKGRAAGTRSKLAKCWDKI